MARMDRRSGASTFRIHVRPKRHARNGGVEHITRVQALGTHQDIPRRHWVQVGRQLPMDIFRNGPSTTSTAAETLIEDRTRSLLMVSREARSGHEHTPKAVVEIEGARPAAIKWRQRCRDNMEEVHRRARIIGEARSNTYFESPWARTGCKQHSQNLGKHAINVFIMADGRQRSQRQPEWSRPTPEASTIS